jgi:hypothetical protein
LDRTIGRLQRFLELCIDIAEVSAERQVVSNRSGQLKFDTRAASFTEVTGEVVATSRAGENQLLYIFPLNIINRAIKPDRIIE